MSVPKLRFKADDGSEYPEWEEKEIENYLEIRNEKQVPTNEAPLMAFIANIGVAEKGERYDRSFLVKDDSKKYKRTELNDFIYSSNNLDVGSIGLNTYGTAVISDVYEIFKPKENVVPKVINNVIQRPQNISKILQYRQGCLYGQYRIYAEDFLSVKITMPAYFKEQQKISDFFSTLDQIIDKTQAEIDAWEKQKQGMMQKLFSQEIRFKADDGSGYPEWEEKSLGDLCIINPTTDPIADEFYYIDLDSVKKGQLVLKNIVSKKEAPSRAQRVLSKDDVLFQSVRPYLKNHYYYENTFDKQVVASTGYCQLRMKNGNNKFLYQLLFSDQFNIKVDMRCTGSNYPAINGSSLAEINVFIPKSISEQRKIADCLSAFDSVIDKTKQELETYKLLKKGLMQQMFV